MLLGIKDCSLYLVCQISTLYAVLGSILKSLSSICRTSFKGDWSVGIEFCLVWIV